MRDLNSCASFVPLLGTWSFTVDATPNKGKGSIRCLPFAKRHLDSYKTDYVLPNASVPNLMRGIGRYKTDLSAWTH